FLLQPTNGKKDNQSTDTSQALTICNIGSDTSRTSLPSINITEKEELPTIITHHRVLHTPTTSRSSSVSMPVLATDGITLPDFNFTLIEMNNKLSEIHRKQCEIEQRVQIVNERLVALEQTLPLGTPNSINKVGNDQLPKKKFSSFDELQEFEANFTEETRKQM
ncbi:hypothetical protein PPYR_15164, partial [Photinus pyralis]